MNYTKEVLINIMKNNCECKVCHDGILGDYIEMNPINAFRYCVITGSGYIKLDEPELRKIFKRDVFRIFNQANQYVLQYGVFDEKSLKVINSTKQIFEKYPFVLEGNKKIVFVEYTGRTLNGEPAYNHKIRNIAEQIESVGMKPTDVIITLVNLDKIKDLESFFEFLICENYSENGYMTDSQVPFFYASGTPDIAAYNMTELSALLKNRYGFSACSFFELMHLDRLNRKSCDVGNVEDVVFEVKTGSTNGSQITKYIDKQVFDRAFEVIAHKKTKSDYAGLISFNNDGSKNVELGDWLTAEKKDDYKEWLSNYAKMYILAGLSEDKYNKFLKDYNIANQDDLISAIKKITLEQVLLLGE